MGSGASPYREHGHEKAQTTPRRKGSVWSRVNQARVAERTSLGLMQPTGLAAHQRRAADRSGIYAYEQRKSARLPPLMTAQFKASPEA